MTIWLSTAFTVSSATPTTIKSDEPPMLRPSILVTADMITGKLATMANPMAPMKITYFDTFFR